MVAVVPQSYDQGGLCQPPRGPEIRSAMGVVNKVVAR